jgi:uncharacterized protein YrrD/pyrimidine deaminase RibD-like protein
MRKGSDIVGKPIVAYDTGEKIGRVRDLIFDQDRNYLVALLIQEGGLMSDARILPLVAIKSIGMDAAIVSRSDTIIPAKSDPQVAAILDRNNIINGTHIMTVSGQDLGKMVDLYFDETTGAIEGYEVSGGIFADAYSGRSFVPAVQTLRIGENYAFVPVMVAGLMEEQIGGIKAAIQDTNDKVQATAQDISTKASAATAHYSVDQALGRRATTVVRTRDGLIVAAPGQIVTEKTIERAQTYHLEEVLLRSVGLSTSTAAKSSANDTLDATAHQIGHTADRVGTQVQSGIAQSIEWAKQAGKKLRTQSTQALESKQIKGALGRPATRVILDRQDRVILNTGELITHQSIEDARRAEMLEVLLSSVYTKTPEFSDATLRAPEPGRAALPTAS